MTYRAIVFDLDGTLLDTLADIGDACNAALAQHAFPVHPVDAYRYFVGDGVAFLLRRALPEAHRDDTTIARVAQTYRVEYGKRWHLKSRPYEGIGDLLDALDARKIPLAVFSNKPDEFTQQCVTKLLPRWSFSMVMGASNAFARKPDPAGALHIARTLNVPPERFIYVGDTSTDMETAVSAGMLPVGVEWGFRTVDELEASGARHIIRHPRELVALIDRL